MGGGGRWEGNRREGGRRTVYMVVLKCRGESGQGKVGNECGGGRCVGGVWGVAVGCGKVTGSH